MTREDKTVLVLVLDKTRQDTARQYKDEDNVDIYTSHHVVVVVA
jgi:hypothetical protein